VDDRVYKIEVHFLVLEELGLVANVLFFQRFLVLKLQLYFGEALHVGIGDLTKLGRVALWNLLAPPHAIELKEKLHNKNGMGHVDKSEAHSLLRF
jgi:hypothetical protein